MKIRIWEIKFRDFDRINVVAPNIKEAIEKARILRKGQYLNRVQDITNAEILAEED